MNLQCNSEVWCGYPTNPRPRSSTYAQVEEPRHSWNTRASIKHPHLLITPSHKPWSTVSYVYSALGSICPIVQSFSGFLNKAQLKQSSALTCSYSWGVSPILKFSSLVSGDAVSITLPTQGRMIICRRIEKHHEKYKTLLSLQTPPEVMLQHHFICLKDFPRTSEITHNTKAA